MRSTLTKLVIGIAVATILAFFAGRQQQLLDSNREILRQLENFRKSLQIEPPPVDFNVKIDGAPMKGAANAKVALMSTLRRGFGPCHRTMPTGSRPG